MTKHVFSFILCLLLIFCLSSSLVSASDNHGENDLNASTYINGYSKFVIEDDININSEFNSSWEVSITLSDQIGTDLLENSELGLRAQIDIYLGNSDGFIDSNESNLFDTLFRSERNWTNSENGGCCIFDYNPLYASQGIEINTTKVVTGPIRELYMGLV